MDRITTKLLNKLIVKYQRAKSPFDAAITKNGRLVGAKQMSSHYLGMIDMARDLRDLLEGKMTEEEILEEGEEKK